VSISISLLQQGQGKVKTVSAMAGVLTRQHVLQRRCATLSTVS
jgi:hypothetical protein